MSDLNTSPATPPVSSGTAPSLSPSTPPPVQSLPTHPMAFLEAVAREEGFYLAGTRPQRNNNPGDIEFGKFTQAHGATAGDPRFAIFPDPDSGFAAMRALFECSAYAGLTVSAALNKWAPPVENQTNAYIANVCTWTGLTADTVIDDILDGIPAPPPPTDPDATQPVSA